MMFSLKHFNTVARIESKTLMRSWFLRIFALIAFTVLIFFNFLISQQEFSPRVLRGLPSNIPYVTLLIFNVIQAVIAVFLATDFMKRDKKQDTTEVIYVRPVSNGEYIWGKVYGNLRVFLLLNVLILIIPLIFTLVTRDMTFKPLGYGLYFVLISIPTLLFIFGLSFFFMALIRNQAVVMLVLLGYIALTLFYLSDKFYYLFDYMSFNIPMIWSEFTGLADPARIILHKALYVSLGLSLVFFTVLLMKRLRQSNTNYWISIAGGVLFLGLAGWLAANHIGEEVSLRRFRSKIIQLNDRYLMKQTPTVGQYHLDMVHRGQNVGLKARMTVSNPHAKPLDTLLFSLNPGFELENCRVNGKSSPYFRKLHLTGIEYHLPPGDSVKVTLQYAGRPDERVCYPEVPDHILFRGDHMTLFRIPKKFSYLTSEYLMFTPELLWYPVPGTGFSSKNVAGFRKNFATYQLSVETAKNLTVLSQGKGKQENNQWIFQPEKPLTCLSVIAGGYQRDSMTIGDINYNVFYKKGHDIYRPFFKDIQDTIPSIIKRVMEDYTSALHLDYPFQTFSVVEVPAHFYAYKKNFTVANDAALPQMVLMQERAYSMNGADFSRAVKRFEKRRNANRTVEKMKTDMLRNFVHSNFIEGEDYRRGWFRGGDITGKTKIFPNFVSYCNDFGVKELPVMNPVLERYIENRSAGNERRGFYRNSGFGDEEKANLLLQDHSFADLMSDTSHYVRLSDVIDVKGSYFINLMKHFAGPAQFDPMLDSFIIATRYQNNTGEKFLEYIHTRYRVDTEEHMDEWLYSRSLPAFKFSDANAFSYYDQENLRYQAELTIHNVGKSLGTVKLNMRIGRRRNSRLSEEKIIILDPGQSKRVGLTVSERPSMILANTLVSSNMPETILFPLRNIADKENAEGGAFVRLVEPPPDDQAIIVDNEDPAFRTLASSEATKLRDLILANRNQRREYTNVNVWRPPEKWQKAIHNKFYGKIKLSASYVRSGDGNQKALWAVPIENAGYYEVQAYVSNAGLQPRWRRRRNDDNEEKLYYYTVAHDGGEETIPVDVKEYPRDWVRLGEFYFSPDTARIQLSNKTKARTVIADAVKLIRK